MIYVRRVLIEILEYIVGAILIAGAIFLIVLAYSLAALTFDWLTSGGL